MRSSPFRGRLPDRLARTARTTALNAWIPGLPAPGTPAQTPPVPGISGNAEAAGRHETGRALRRPPHEERPPAAALTTCAGADEVAEARHKAPRSWPIPASALTEDRTSGRAMPHGCPLTRCFVGQADTARRSGLSRTTADRPRVAPHP
ncbi:hypothetical protein GZL_02844 [Streptomyces sp. 769]|nr:hypothetical protein GZL_02844 [Streptomyces sp. 769]